ncbi:MAG: NAD(P)H-dependent oxidoreductase [Kordiimonadaceae bacterium]|nr:NAD(P)H-dependent oxidoreductase [Kordiimonadaceae bacterium]
MSERKVKLVAFSGSSREKSLNKKLVKIAAEGARMRGADVTLIDLRDYPMPLYDGDLEEGGGYPDTARKLKTLFLESDGFLIASPEYNSGYSAILKNTLDWVSRPLSADEPPLAAYAGKYATIMSAAPGALGGLRGLYQLRELLMNMNVTVLPEMRAVSHATGAFDGEGQLLDESLRHSVQQLGAQTVLALNKGEY